MQLGNVIRKGRRWKAEQRKLMYLLRLKKKLRRMSVSIYDILLYIILLLFITNSDKSPTMKEKSLYSIIQLNANVT